MEKYLHKYVFLKNGNWFYVKDAVGEQLYLLYDKTNDSWIYDSFHEEDVDHIADEICAAVTIE